jgi:hypothetical protein
VVVAGGGGEEVRCEESGLMERPEPAEGEWGVGAGGEVEEGGDGVDVERAGGGAFHEETAGVAAVPDIGVDLEVGELGVGRGGEIDVSGLEGSGP